MVPTHQYNIIIYNIRLNYVLYILYIIDARIKYIGTYVITINIEFSLFALKCIIDYCKVNTTGDQCNMQIYAYITQYHCAERIIIICRQTLLIFMNCLLMCF